MEETKRKKAEVGNKVCDMVMGDRCFFPKTGKDLVGALEVHGDGAGLLHSHEPCSSNRPQKYFLTNTVSTGFFQL